MNPEFAPAANNLAWMIAEEEGGDLGEAMRLALVAKEQYPEDPYIADTLGWVHYKRQSYSLALTQFVQAANDLPDNMTVQYHLALALKAEGEIDKARETLTAVLASGSEFPEKDAATKLLQNSCRNNYYRAVMNFMSVSHRVVLLLDNTSLKAGGNHKRSGSQFYNTIIKIICFIC